MNLIAEATRRATPVWTTHAGRPNQTVGPRHGRIENVSELRGKNPPAYTLHTGGNHLKVDQPPAGDGETGAKPDQAQPKTKKNNACATPLSSALLRTRSVAKDERYSRVAISKTAPGRQTDGCPNVGKGLDRTAFRWQRKSALSHHSRRRGGVEGENSDGLSRYWFSPLVSALDAAQRNCRTLLRACRFGC
jgi:hypothetical protein